MVYSILLSSERGQVSARLEPRGKQRVPKQLRVGLLLDGRHVGELDGIPAKKRGGFDLTFALPPFTLAQQLDLVDLASGSSLLPAPHDLSAVYQFRFDRMAVEAGRVTGQFAVTGLADRLWVECSAGARSVARGFALRDGEVYRFDIPLLSCVPVNDGAVMLPWVAGRPLTEHHVALRAVDIGIAGFVDSVGPGYISGWAASLAQESERLSVDLVVEGEVVDTVVADQPRADLVQAGFGDGYSGFHFVLPANDVFRHPRSVSVVISGTGLELCNSPLTALPQPAFQGSFDRLHGTAAHGWALNRFEPEKPVTVEAVCEGKVLAKAEAKLFRGDLLDAGLNGGFCAYKIDIGPQLLDLLGKPVSVRIAGAEAPLSGSPKTAEQNPNYVRYLRPLRGLDPDKLPRLKRMMNRRAGPDGLSIVMPVYNTPRDWLIQALESVRTQWCDRWELICVNDCSTQKHVAPVLDAFAKHDPRIRVLHSPVNMGIARATNLGLRAARASYVGFMDHDDYLEPDAVYHMLRAAKLTGGDFIYSDEVLTDDNIGSIADTKLRPQFSYDYYLSHPYFVHFLAVRRDLAHAIGGWDESMAISADVDFVLRVLEQAKVVTHVPRVLYRWRTHESSTGHSKKDAVMAATRGSIQRHLDRRKTGATVADGVWFNQFRIDWPANDGRILIVIPTKNRAGLVRTAVESIERTAAGLDYRLVVVDHESDDPESQAYFAELAQRHTVMPYAGPFNYSAINNAAVKAHGEGCAFVLFLNNDVEAITDGWLDRMRRLAARSDVGVVGALLLYPDKRVQHGGVIIGFNGSAEATFKFEDAYIDADGKRNLGYNCSLTSVRDYSAVTAACLMMRRAVFEKIGGFDEDLVVGMNDVDLCLRVRELGLKVLYDGATVLFHYESATRSRTKQVLHPEDSALFVRRWDKILREGDPYYNPNLSLLAQDHCVREDAGCKIAHYRSVALPQGLSAGSAATEEPALPASKPARPRRRNAA